MTQIIEVNPIINIGNDTVNVQELVKKFTEGEVFNKTKLLSKLDIHGRVKEEELDQLFSIMHLFAHLEPINQARRGKDDDVVFMSPQSPEKMVQIGKFDTNMLNRIVPKEMLRTRYGDPDWMILAQFALAEAHSIEQ